MYEFVTLSVGGCGVGLGTGVGWIVTGSEVDKEPSETKTVPVHGFAPLGETVIGDEPPVTVIQAIVVDAEYVPA